MLVLNKNCKLFWKKLPVTTPMSMNCQVPKWIYNSQIRLFLLPVQIPWRQNYYWMVIIISSNTNILVWPQNAMIQWKIYRFLNWRGWGTKYKWRIIKGKPYPSGIWKQANHMYGNNQSTSPVTRSNRTS